MITQTEQIELFHTLHDTNLLDLLSNIEDICKNEALPILNLKNQDISLKFIELILNNIDLKKMFLQHYKKKK